MTTPRRRILFVAAVVLQLLFLGGMAAKRWWLLERGTPVLLRCEPVDPRSLLSGDYVILRFECSRFETKREKLLLDGSVIETHRTVFVPLARETNGPHWTALGVCTNASEARRRSPVFLRGEVTGNYPLMVRYGAEQYFVPQGEGLHIERAVRRQEVSAELRVSPSGESGLKRLFINGSEVRFH